MVGAPDPLDATFGRGGDLLEGVAGQVGQFHPLEAGSQALHRVQLRGVARQQLHHQARPPPPRPGAHRQAAVGGQPVPHQRRLLPPRKRRSPSSAPIRVSVLRWSPSTRARATRQARGSWSGSGPRVHPRAARASWPPPAGAGRLPDDQGGGGAPPCRPELRQPQGGHPRHRGGDLPAQRACPPLGVGPPSTAATLPATRPHLPNLRNEALAPSRRRAAARSRS